MLHPERYGLFEFPLMNIVCLKAYSFPSLSLHVHIFRFNILRPIVLDSIN